MAGLGALGWSDAWYPGASVVPGVDIATTATAQRNRTCGSGRRMVCATPNEQAYLVREGCGGTQYNGSNICTTSDRNIGSLWCCASDRPRLTREDQPAAIEQIAVSSRDITALQTWINQQSGCSAGRADGAWGPNTRTGLNCVAGRVGWAEVVRRFPFVQTLVGTAAGYTTPDTMIFSPGSTAKLPGQVTGGGGAAVSPGAQEPGATETPPPEEANVFGQIFGALPWWGWLGIAGGVGLLAVIGVAAMKSGEEEEEETPETSEERRPGSIEKYGF